MSSHVPDRKEAWDLLCEFNKTDALRKHALAVEGVMRFMARKAGGDEDEWGLIGLVHDLDYEMYPGEHCIHTERILRERAWPESWIRAVLSHAWGTCSDLEPHTALEKTLYATDELTGLVAATALVRPGKSIMDLKVKSVRKKWKNARFAAGVDRSIIERGAEMLGVELADLISDVIDGMKEVAADLGLAGEEEFS